MVNPLSPLLPIIILLLSFPLAGFAAELSPNSSKECAMCHFNWIDDFSMGGKASELAEYPKEKMVAAEMMCYSCHDGSVADSRFKVWETNKHKTGVKPSDRVVIPPGFPLDKEGNIQCFTCHSAHGVDTKPGMESTIFLRMPNKDSSICKMCHVGKDRGPKKGSHPVDVTSFDIPEEIIKAGGKAGGKAGTKKNKIICQTCHAPHGSTSEKFLVMPIRGKWLTGSALCEACHTVRPDINEKSSMRSHSHPIDVPLLSEATLPERWQNGDLPRLSADGRINCITCHSPHNGISNAHLLVEKNEKGSLCITCHPSKRSVAYSKHNMEIAAPAEKNLDGKTVFETGVCSACHFMHKGKGAKMWARDMPGWEEKDTISMLCKSCHSRDRVAGRKLTGDISHPVWANLPKGVDISGLPLFGQDGEKAREGKVTCATCHNVHQWDPLNFELRVSKETEGDAYNSFLRKRAAPSPDLCEACHPDNAYIEKTNHDLSITAPKSLNVRREAVAKSGVCGTCHLVHNARAQKLWARTPGQGKDSIERLCNGCHTDGGIAEEKVTGAISHPLGNTPVYPATSLKTLPLYNDKGWKDEDGIMSCATCHNVHIWDPLLKKKGIGIRQEGDRFNSFLRIPYDDDAALCSNCHNNVIIKGTKHDLKLSAPDEKNAVGEEADKGPVCGACHLVHKALGPKLWARQVRQPGNDVISGLCLGCHSNGMVAEKKQIGKITHPLSKRIVDAKETLKRELEGFYSYSVLELPLFNKEGNRDRYGQIACATCHNTHQWDPQSVVNVGGKNVEGDGGNSFLRKSALIEADLCGTCHTEKRLVFRTEHDMAVVKPDEKNILGKTIGDSGVCSACHLVHNTRERYKLWARETGDGDSRPMMLCMSCHARGKVAEAKVPQYLKHPSDVLALEEAHALDVGFVPLYDKNGKESSSGIISCPTCHNPHRWNSEQKGFGPGKNTEGRAVNSFLRSKSMGNVCKNCHGFESLIRYKFFHTDSFRGKSASIGTR